VPEVIKYSSNIGTAKIAAAVGAQKQQEYFRKLGLFDPVAVELPERGAPMFPKRWSEITMMTTSYGHGIAVSPLHLARATAAAVNGGMLVQPTILKIGEGKKPVAERVFKEETAIHMRNLLRLVVSEGTGKSSDVQGYMVGGKTGTAEKTTAGGYSKKAVLTAFAATFPSNDPKYFTLVMFDEPQPTAKTMNMSTAGWNAAPITGKLIERIAPMLGVMPFDYEEKIMADHSIMMQEEN
jgi:cell division protein FtsI (penicillin-binding protein 3)